MASVRGLFALRQLVPKPQALVPRRFVHFENGPGQVSVYCVLFITIWSVSFSRTVPGLLVPSTVSLTLALMRVVNIPGHILD